MKDFHNKTTQIMPSANIPIGVGNVSRIINGCHTLEVRALKDRWFLIVDGTQRGIYADTEKEVIDRINLFKKNGFIIKPKYI